MISEYYILHSLIILYAMILLTLNLVSFDRLKPVKKKKIKLNTYKKFFFDYKIEHFLNLKASNCVAVKPLWSILGYVHVRVKLTEASQPPAYAKLLIGLYFSLQNAGQFWEF